MRLATKTITWTLHLVDTLLSGATSPNILWFAFALAVLFGICVLLDPWCLVSKGGSLNCDTDFDQMWRHYPGKGAALQFDGTSALFWLMVIVLGLSSVYENARQRLGPTRIALVTFLTALAYVFLLLGLYADFANQNKNLAVVLAILYILITGLYGIILGSIAGLYLVIKALLNVVRVLESLSKWVSNKLGKSKRSMD